MKNKNMKKDFGLMIVNRVNDNITFYISKKLLIDYNYQSKNLYPLNKKDNLHDFDYFELEINIKIPSINIYKPHYYGKQSTNLLYYIDKYIVKWMEDLSGEDIMKIYK